MERTREHESQYASNLIEASLDLMGINIDFEDMAKKVQEYALTHKHSKEISELGFNSIPFVLRHVLN